MIGMHSPPYTAVVARALEDIGGLVGPASWDVAVRLLERLELDGVMAIDEEPWCSWCGEETDLDELVCQRCATASDEDDEE